jgi:hypothetical protein
MPCGQPGQRERGIARAQLGFARFILRRSRGDRRLLFGAFAGIFIAATVVAAAPMYLRSLEKVGVADALDGMGPYNPNIQITTHWLPLDRTEFQAADSAVSRLRQQYVQDLVRSKEHLIKSTSFFWAQTGQQMRTDPLASELSFLFISNHEAHVRYDSGRAPSVRMEQSSDGAVLVEASVPSQRARQMGIAVGDVLDAMPGASRHGLVRVRISGIFEPLDWDEEYWLGLGEVLLLPSPVRDEQELPLLVLVQEGPALDGVGAVTAGLPGVYWWWLYTRADVLSEMPAGEIVRAVDSFEERLEKAVTQANLISGLEPTFRALQRKLLFARIPMFLLAALAVSAVAYYLFLVAGLLARKREPDTVMLRSRGLSLWQVVRMYAVEAVVLIGVPVAAAPFVALILVSQVGRLPVYGPVTAGGPLPVEVTWKAWGWAAVAGVAAFVVMLAPVLASVKRGVAQQRQEQARPDKPPVFQRYYLDVLLLVLGGFIWWELRAKGTIAVTGAEGQDAYDLTLLFAPAMFLVATVLIFLRAFPLVTRVSSWVAGKTGAAWVAVGFWRLGRSPYWYAWPVLLVVLAAGLAVVTGTLASTLERSNREQAEYQVGGDLRITAGARTRVDEWQIERLGEMPGVRLASRALRQRAVHGTTSAGQPYTMLAVEAERFPAVATFRSDFAARPVHELLSRLELRLKPEPVYLPAGTTEMGIWARTEPAVRDLFLWVVLRDANRTNATVTLGPTGDRWQYQGGLVPQGLAQPVEVVSIQTFQQAGPDGGRPAILFLDDFQVIREGATDGPRVQVIIDFEEPGMWAGLPTSDGLDTTYGLAGEPGQGVVVVGSAPGRTVGRVVMGRGTDNGVRGIYRSATNEPIPVLANPLFMAATNARQGEPFVTSVGGAYAPVVIVGTVSYFPTLDPAREPFLIADVGSLTEFLELRGLSEYGANEVFVDLVSDGVDTETATNVRSLFPGGNIANRAVLLNDSVVDPLAVAGWRGIGVVAVGIGAVASVLGYATYLSAHARRTRADAAYMRSLGFSRSAYLRMALIEHSIVGAIGIGLGIAAGLVVSGLAADSIAHTATGRELLPPFVLQTNWVPAALLLAAVVAAVAVSIAAILRAFARAPIHELVRSPE